ncbi:MAG TPA: AraC family transcriptional regulator [Kofleriaceae bacterium]|nr:AraC family transcriptional regulator [Kofleriaceae bacterium]
MPRLARNVVIQFPRNAPAGFPVSIARLDGHGAPIHSPRPHSHGFFALMFAIDGDGMMRVGRNDLPVHAGSVVITAPGEVHDTAAMAGVSRWGLDFTPDAFGSEAAGWMFPRPSRPEWVALLRRSWDVPSVIDVPELDRSEWHARFATIARELTRRELGYREIVRGEVKAILIGIGRLLAPGSVYDPMSPLLGEVFDAIEARFSTAISLAGIARAVGRSPAHLTTVVREQTGMTVQQWIIERRMAEARQRLMASDENIEIIAERVGYRDATLFIRHFKRAHGVTPRRWRNAT